MVHAPLRFPFASMATMPIVSWLLSWPGVVGCLFFSIKLSGVTIGLYFDVFTHSCHAFSLPAVNKFSFLKPFASANSNAPCPTRIMCGVFSITSLATEIGCMICSRHITEPQFPFSSMMQESRVTRPSRSGKPP